MRLGAAAALLLSLAPLAAGAEAGCGLEAALASCHAAAPGADVRCWAGVGTGFVPEPHATAAGAWCATRATGVPAIVGIPGAMVTYEPPVVCAYLFTNYAFGFRLFCVPVA